jgi:hypothetical protein
MLEAPTVTTASSRFPLASSSLPLGAPAFQFKTFFERTRQKLTASVAAFSKDPSAYGMIPSYSQGTPFWCIMVS